MLDEVTMTTEADNDNGKAGRARARLAKKLKNAVARSTGTEREHDERKQLSAFQVWLKQTKDMVRISQRRQKPEPRPDTAAARRQDSLQASVRQSRALDTGDDNHVLVPVKAVTKAALGDELYGISLHIQGYVLAHSRSGVANYRGDSRAPALDLSQEQRGQLIAMHNWVQQKLPLEMKKMADIVIDQTLQLNDRPPMTVSEVGAFITQSEDERVRKGGVVGYYRAMFQTMRQLQMEWHITQAVRRVGK